MAAAVRVGVHGGRCPAIGGAKGAVLGSDETAESSLKPPKREVDFFACALCYGVLEGACALSFRCLMCWYVWYEKLLTSHGKSFPYGTLSTLFLVPF